MRDRLHEWVVPASALLFAALCINFSWVHALHDGDSILLPLISTLRWTPFYWGDNRYGMPVPLLVSWIRDPSWNLLLQTQLFSVAAVGLVAVGNVFYVHAKDTPLRVRIGTACIAMAIAFAVLRPTYRTARMYVLADPYVISLVPLLVAVAIALRVERMAVAIRLLVALPLVFVSLWINFSHVLVAMSLGVLLPHETRRWRDTIVLRGWFLAITAACFVAVRAWASGYSNWGEPRLALAGWTTTASKLWSNVAQRVVQPAGVLVLFFCAVVAGIYLARRGSLRWRDALVIGGVSVMFAGTVASSDWPMQNGYEPRYWTTPLTLLLLVATAVVGRAVMALFEGVSPRLSPMFAAILLIIVSLRVFGLPNPVKTRALLMATAGKTGVHAVTLGCTHMIGEYHAAWMSTFYARSAGQDVWAAVPRGEVTRDLWDRMPPRERKFCGTVNQGAILQSLSMFKLGVPSWSGYSGGLVRYELR